MTPAVPRAPRLLNQVTDLQARGRYTFTRAEITEALARPAGGVSQSLGRLVRQRRLFMPRRGFYVVVPTEYRELGAPPISWFLDDLMRAEGRPYYVGLLTAAELHGAAHNAPQEFQVIVADELRPVRVGRERLVFVQSVHAGRVPATARKTATGTMRVSTPGGTAVDLVRFVHRCGGLENVAVVLGELAEAIVPGDLAAACKGAEAATLQRLGWLLDRLGHSALASAVEAELPSTLWWTPLAAGDPDAGSERSARWRIVVNAVMEADA